MRPATWKTSAFVFSMYVAGCGADEAPSADSLFDDSSLSGSGDSPAAAAPREFGSAGEVEGDTGFGAGAVSAGDGDTGGGDTGAVYRVTHKLVDGTCCSDGDCICRDGPIELTGDNGPYRVDSANVDSGRAFWPRDAEPPFAAIAICGGFLNSGFEMFDWGEFYASHGIVTLVTATFPTDLPGNRADRLLAAIEELKRFNDNDPPNNALAGKLAGRYGTSGYSMGGGGTTLAAQANPELKTSIGLAAWGPTGWFVSTPTLYLCSDADSVAGCIGSGDAFDEMVIGTPRMMINFDGESHFAWFGPRGAGWGQSGAYALAFQKVFLEGDERWRDVLLEPPVSAEFLHEYMD